MKTKIFNLFRAGLLCCGVAAALTACSPDEFSGADPNGLPTVSGVDFQMTVDQETNQMVATYTPAAGTYPIWIIDGTSYSNLQEVGYTNTEAGTHTIELKLGNRNGISQAGVTKTFTFNETKIDWSADFRRITGKEWRIDNKEVGHMGCGPAGTDATGWWSAAVDDKKGFGVYDDRLTFTADTRKGGTYSYNAGADGMTYVNKGCTTWGTQNDDADVDVAIGNQDATWNFEVLDWTNADGEVTTGCKYLHLAANTVFPYISSDAQYEDPLFRVEQLTNSKMVVYYETPDRSIAWRFVFTSAAEEKPFMGFDANSDFNLWKGITPTASFHFQPGWADVRTSEMEDGYRQGDNDYTVFVPDACNDRWQAQFHLHTTDVNISAANHYDFSVVMNADKDIDGVTIKLTNEADNDAIIDVDNISLKANEDYVFWLSDIEGKNLQPVKLVFDFGRAAEPTTVNITNVVLKDHANDDGTVLPEVNPGGGDEPSATVDWDETSAANLWSAVEDGSAFDAFGYYFADNGWGGIPYNEVNHHDGIYELDLPEGLGGSQWQGQFHIDTKLTASAAKAYNFYLVMEADADCPQVTFKLTDSGDSNFFFEERHDVKADVPFVFKKEGVVLKEGADASAIRLFFDFGGSTPGAHVKISKIYFEETVVLDYDDPNNLWRAVDDGSMFDAFGYYFADNGWGGIAYSEVNHSGDTYELDLPEGLGGSQWQGQFHIDTKLTASAAKQYHFQLQMEVDQDCPQITFKLTDAGDSNFFFEERVDVPADEPFVFKRTFRSLKDGADASAIRMFFDFGGSPAGTHVKISKIVFKEAQ